MQTATESNSERDIATIYTEGVDAARYEQTDVSRAPRMNETLITAFIRPKICGRSIGSVRSERFAGMILAETWPKPLRERATSITLNDMGIVKREKPRTFAKTGSKRIIRRPIESSFRPERIWPITNMPLIGGRQWYILKLTVWIHCLKKKMWMEAVTKPLRGQ